MRGRHYDTDRAALVTLRPAPFTHKGLAYACGTPSQHRRRNTSGKENQKRIYNAANTQPSKHTSPRKELQPSASLFVRALPFDTRGGCGALFICPQFVRLDPPLSRRYVYPCASRRVGTVRRPDREPKKKEAQEKRITQAVFTAPQALPGGLTCASR